MYDSFLNGMSQSRSRPGMSQSRSPPGMSQSRSGPGILIPTRDLDPVSEHWCTVLSHKIQRFNKKMSVHSSYNLKLKVTIDTNWQFKISQKVFQQIADASFQSRHPIFQYFIRNRLSKIVQIPMIQQFYNSFFDDQIIFSKFCLKVNSDGFETDQNRQFVTFYS